MALDFDSGNPNLPRGHAIIYFRARYDPETLLAIYAITLPIAFDFSKFVPPFLTAHLAADPMKELKAFSLPPVPEQVESYEYLQRVVGFAGGRSGVRGGRCRRTTCRR